jgi:hypothetical protein
VNPSIFLPPDTTFAIVQPFIRECVKTAWQMSALAHPLDIAVSSRAELYDDTKLVSLIPSYSFTVKRYQIVGRIMYHEKIQTFLGWLMICLLK